MPAIKSCLWFHADAVSFVVPCESQADVDRYSDALVRGGEEGQCGWLEDCFGVSWQVVPNELGALLGDPDPAKAGRVMQAMLGMKKLNVSAFRRATARRRARRDARGADRGHHAPRVLRGPAERRLRRRRGKGSAQAGLTISESDRRRFLHER